MPTKLVVFYSWGENTKAVAEYICAKTGADILELKVKDAYPTDYRECVNKVGKDGKSYEPELSVTMPDLKGVDLIFVGSPCWWGTIANPVRAFLNQNDLTGKTVAPFMTHGTTGLRVGDIKRLCPNSKILAGLGIYNCYQVSNGVNTVANLGNFQKQVDEWLAQIGQ